MRRLLLVANPSSSGFTGALHRDVVATLSAEFDVTPVWPLNPAATRQRALDAATDGFEVVVAMGGDGVVHHVANGLIGTGTALGVVPAGTTNVVSRIHGAPRSARKAAAALTTAKAAPTSVVLITTDSDVGTRSEYALFSVGIGFDADVVEVAEQRPESKLWFGSLHFARAAVGRVMGPYRRKSPDLMIEVMGDRVRALSLFVQVHHLYTYFGRLPMSFTSADMEGPAAVAVESLDPRLAAQIVGRLTMRRDLAKLPKVHRWTGFERVVATADSTAPFQADGEHLGHAHSIAIEPVPDALLVLKN